MSIKILDCTLRDGGRIIDCKFSHNQVLEVSTSLLDCGIEFVELGFLEDTKKQNHETFSTYFDDIKKTQNFIKQKASYSVFTNFGRYDFGKLCDYQDNLPKYIRLGFTLQDFLDSYSEIKKTVLEIKNKGYNI